MPASKTSLHRDYVAGFALSGNQGNAQAMVQVDSSGNEAGFSAAGTDRSGSATTTSGQIIAANASRKGLRIQNIGANNIGVNEFGGTAAIGTAGTCTLVPGAWMDVRTNRAVFAIAATGATAFSATEW